MISNQLKDPFSHTDVNLLKKTALEQSPDVATLKERVTNLVSERIGLGSDSLPKRVKTWIHQICLPHTAGTELKIFTGKLGESIDLASLSGRIK